MLGSLSRGTDETLRLGNHVVFEVLPKFNSQSSPMLVKHFSRHEWEVVISLSLCLLRLLSPLESIIKLLLIIEEEEFIFENIRASQFHSILIVKFLLDAL